MRYSVSLGAIHPPAALAEFAALAEASGWDAIFLEDYIIYQGQIGTPTFDPWVSLAAMAAATKQIRLGTLVTPLPRRRPWKLAAEVITLDHLSNGRLILGLGAGDKNDPSFGAAGEPTNPRTLASLLDEGLDLLAKLLTGESVTHPGTHFTVRDLKLTPSTLQQPRVPIWIGGNWLVPAVRRRAVRWDGACVYRGTPGGDDEASMTPEDVEEVVAAVTRERGTAACYDICIGGTPRGDDREKARDRVRAIASAGATWWQEWIAPTDSESTREAIRRGPLRID